MFATDTSSLSDHAGMLISGINAWSVSGNTLASEDLASSLFAVSLFPYLAFIYFLSRPETKTPKLANFGFQFLLVFVFATIPAGIYAKVAYHDILANVDWLHGTAESFLTITNLLITLGIRQVRRGDGNDPTELPKQSVVMRDVASLILILFTLLTSSFFSFGQFGIVLC